MIRKIFLYSTLLYFLTPLTLSLLSSGFKDITWSGIGIMVLAAIVISAIGFYLGLFLCAIVQRPRLEKWLYISSQFVTIVSLAIFAWANTRTDTPPAPDRTANDRYVDDFGVETPAIRIAYDSLKLKFTDPEAFRIETSVSHLLTPHVRFEGDSLWEIYLVYALAHDKVPERFAKYDVLGGEARLLEFNRSQSESEFQALVKDLRPAKAIADSIANLPSP